MNAKSVPFVLGLTVVSVFLAVLGWEFVLEETVLVHLFPAADLAASQRHWLSLAEAALAAGLVGTLQGSLYLHAAKARQSSDRELRTILDNLQDVFYRTDLQGRIVMTSPSCEQVFGYAPAEVIGKQLADFYVDPADREEFLAELKRNGGTVTGFEAALRHREGRDVWVSTSAHYYRCTGGEIAGVEGIARDITDRRDAEHARAVAESDLSDAIESIPDGFVLFDAEDRLVRCNTKYRELFASVSDLLVPGAKFEDLVRAQFARRQFTDAVGKEEECIQERLAQHRDPASPRELRFSDGRWIRSSEQRTPAGGIVGILSNITELKQRQQELGQAQRMGQIGHWRWRMADDRVEVSEELRRIYGFDPDAPAMVKDFTDTYHEDDADAVFAKRRAAVAHGDPYEFALRIRRKDGELRFLEGRAEPEHDEDGQLTGYFGITRDVTERTEIEARLRQQTELVQTLVDNLPAHIGLRDREGRFLFANQALARDNGVSRESLVGRRLSEVVGEVEAPTLQDLAVTVAETGQPIVNREFRPPRFPERTFLSNVLPQMDEDGEVESVLSISLDISDLKRVEEQLRLSEERLKEAQRIANLGYWVWDSIRDRCVYCSEECAQIHGLTPAEYIERAATITEEFSLVHPDDRAAVQEQFRVLRAGGEIEIDYRLLRSDGEIRYVHEIARPEFDDAGNVVREHGTILDVTALRRSEEQLRQAQKMEAIGQLTGGIAHDFNNLLAVIQGNIAYLNRKVGDDATLKSLTEPALRATRRGASLTQRLLAFSRQQELDVAAVDAVCLVDELAEMLQRSLGEDIEVRLEPSSEVWPCEVDAGQLEQAIINLANNARDAMPDGGVLRIEVQNASLAADEVPQSAARDYVMIAVSDSGIGMTAEVQGKIFDPFFTTKEIGKGTGLGLSMVYGFITQSGGYVTVDSAPDSGAVFRLYLPRANTDAVALEAPAPCGDRGRGETVLLVEDEEDLRTITRLQLADLGYRVLDAADGDEALTLLRAHGGVDLLLTDVVLGGTMNGPEIATAARAADPALKIAYMSGYPGEALKAHGDFDDGKILIRKPFERDELAHFLHLAMEQG